MGVLTLYISIDELTVLTLSIHVLDQYTSINICCSCWWREFV